MQSYVLVIGELLIDAISCEYVDHLGQAASLSLHPGGSAANFCRFLHTYQVPTRLVAAVGQDGLGRQLIDHLQSIGLDTSYVATVAQHATSLIVVGRTKGTPDFIPYRGADAQIAPITDDLIEPAGLLHTSAFALSQQPARDTILQAFDKAAQRGIPVSIDWNYSEKIWANPEEARQTLEKLQMFKPLFKFSLDDVSRMTGEPMSIVQAKVYLSNLQSNVVCLTCGGDGVWYKHAQEDWQYLPAQAISDIKDATGAGDAFWAGFVKAYLRNSPLAICVQQGIDTASQRLRGIL
ncbi:MULTISPECIES: carbohydrate kinase family protein [unclassified Siphonobacter]|uniref:carbohydrate kinase family protein n=1 Tax=unclassified Siphonobacter TaxID=2635712 RepID=UPI00278918BE|nr:MULTISPECIES: sugar kinase [unclassified Siphonobacter]MDQ1087620.1 fructokinase [Siphonobacter sp. SORGH_AS_1065]MDR6193772.1 fructokinase [Siphonobacter sp. SORGH_AS_0500]